MSKFWRNFISNGLVSAVERRLGLQSSDGLQAPEQNRGTGRVCLPGLPVMGIRPEGPAEKAGILEGDRILSLDAKPVEGLSDLGKLLETLPAGIPLVVEFQRSQRTVQRWIILDEPPKQARRKKHKR